MNITINEDLTSQVIDDDLTIECNLPNYNPETLKPWGNQAEVEAFIQAKVIGNSNYFMPYVSPEDKEQIRIGIKADEVRAQRNKLLADTDWRFRSDMTPSQDWIDYCQALRDIPSQEGFPENVTWPEQPGA